MALLLSCSLLSSLEMMHESLLLPSFFPKVYQSNRENERWRIGVAGYWRGAKRGLGAFIQCVDRAVGAIVVLCWCWQNIPALHSISFRFAVDFAGFGISIRVGGLVTNMHGFDCDRGIRQERRRPIEDRPLYLTSRKQKR